VNPLEEEENAWPDEPEEFDPDSLGPDPPDSTPHRRSSMTTGKDVPDGLFRAFWTSVLLLNVAIAALSIGAMLIYFLGDYRTGTLALLVGGVAAFGTGKYYWAVKTGRLTDDGPGEREGGAE